jgi:glycosyltransferase involved in cell wall biosynthesis
VETQKRIKVLFITKWYMNRHDPQLGVFIQKHAAAAALHCDVSLLCVLGDAQMKERLQFEEKEENGVKSLIGYYRTFSPAIPFIGRPLNFFRYVRATRAGLELLEKKYGRHDITHAYIMLRPALIAWWLKLTKRIPFVISEQWSGYATGKYQRKNPFVKFLFRLAMRRAAGATAVSEFLKDKMVRAGLKKEFVITPNVVEQAAKKSAPIASDGKIIILTVADLIDEIKNISATISAVAAIAATNRAIEFHIVGHGKDEMLLKELARELNVLGTVVFFHGVKSNADVYQFLHSCDFLVMNSMFETFSLICIEAMSCGKPVIATRCGGPEEFMTESNGMLIEPCSHEALLTALKKMIAGYRQYDSNALKQFAFTHFSAEQTGKKFLELYRMALRN